MPISNEILLDTLDTEPAEVRLTLSDIQAIIVIVTMESESQTLIGHGPSGIIEILANPDHIKRIIPKLYALEARMLQALDTIRKGNTK